MSRKGKRWWNGITGTIEEDVPKNGVRVMGLGNERPAGLPPVTHFDHTRSPGGLIAPWSPNSTPVYTPPGPLEFKSSGAKFPTPHSFERKILINRRLPDVVFLPQVMHDMHLIVDHCSEEVSWIGTVLEQGNNLVVDEIFVLDQEVTGTTTEITEDGLAKLAGRLLEQPDGVEKLNRLRFWGHSHVNMGTSPSGQDDTQVSLWKKNDHPYLIRAIINKAGRLQLSVFLWKEGIEIHDVPWSIQYATEDARAGFWKTELERNVRRHVYKAPENTQGGNPQFAGQFRGVYGGDEFNSW